MTITLVALALVALGLLAFRWLEAQHTALADTVTDLGVRLSAAVLRTRALEQQLEGLTATVAHLSLILTAHIETGENQS